MVRKHARGERDFGKGFGDSDNGFELTMRRMEFGLSTCTRIPQATRKKEGLTGQSWG